MTYERTLSFVMLIAMLTGCTAKAPAPRSPADAEFLRQAESAPLVFRVPKERAEEIMGRAQSYLGLYSRIKIQTATPFLVETYGGDPYRPATSYRIVRRDVGSEAEITVITWSTNEFWRDATKRNAALLSYYLQTGEINQVLILP